MATPRDLAHAEQRARILSVARDHLIRDGAAQLSLRKVIAEVGMVSSAIYRYFPTRDALLTALIIESYSELADALAGVAGEDPETRFRALVRTMLAWGRAHPQEFALIYGSPVSGYRAPQDTIEPAARVVQPFVATAAAAHAAGLLGPRIPAGGELAEQAEALAGALDPDLPAAAVLAVVEAFTLVVGALILELGGHFVGTFEPFDALGERLVATAALVAGFEAESADL